MNNTYELSINLATWRQALDTYRDVETFLATESEALGEVIKFSDESWEGQGAEDTKRGLHYLLEEGDLHKARELAKRMRQLLEDTNGEINALAVRCEGFSEQLMQDDYIAPVRPPIDSLISYNGGRIALNRESADTVIRLCATICEDANRFVGDMERILSSCNGIIDTKTLYEKVRSGGRKLCRVSNFGNSLRMYKQGVERLDEELSISLSAMSGLYRGERNCEEAPALLQQKTGIAEGIEFICVNLEKDDNDIDYNAIEELERTYGFTEEQAILLYDTIEKLGKSCRYEKNSVEYINYVYGTLSTLCISYDAKRWRMTANTPSLSQAKKRLDQAGLSSQQILDLQVLINLQHGDFSDETLKKNDIDITKSTFCNETHADMMARCADQNNDFSHQTIQIAAFACVDMMAEENRILLGPWAIALFNSSDLQHTYTKFEISFKGDIDSGRYSEADFQSDVDAINIYNRMRSDGESSLNEIWTEYYGEIESGDTNRAAEFFRNLGDGEEDIGIIELDHILKKETFGSLYIQNGNDMTQEDIDRANSIFVQWIFSEYYGLEYEFPE